MMGNQRVQQEIERIHYATMKIFQGNVFQVVLLECESFLLSVIFGFTLIVEQLNTSLTLFGRRICV